MSVYKISIGNGFYYGSTKQEIYKRQLRHNFNLRNPEQYPQRLYAYAREQGVKKIICEEIYIGDDYLDKENEYIKNDINCLNMRWSKSSEERKKETAKKYRNSEKGKLTNKRACANDYLKNKDKRLAEKSEYYQKNKEKWKSEEYRAKAKIRAQVRDYCPYCNSEMLKRSIRRHIVRAHIPPISENVLI
ncbi:MAG: hypothetical protein ACR2M9_04880 [Cyanophyceae cyanobacterium]